jgi:2'-5' RNA ligase
MPSKTPSVRCFVAISLPTQVKQVITHGQNHLRCLLPDSIRNDGALRWVQPELMHLTLLFLGEVPIVNLADVESALQCACRKTEPLRLRLGHVGCFPNARSPRVLWIGVAGDTAILQELQTRIASSLRPFVANSEDKEFHPHLTLARIKSKDKALCRQIGQSASGVLIEASAHWEVVSLELMRSELTPSGLRYFVERTVPLKNK